MALLNARKVAFELEIRSRVVDRERWEGVGGGDRDGQACQWLLSLGIKKTYVYGSSTCSQAG